MEKTVIAAPGDPDRHFDGDAVTEKFHAIADSLIGTEEADDWIASGSGALTDSPGLECLIGIFEDLFA